MNERPKADPYDDEPKQCVLDPAQIEVRGDRLLVRCVDRPSGRFISRGGLSLGELKDAQQSLWRVYGVGPDVTDYEVGDYIVVNTKINEPYQDVAGLAIGNEAWALISTGLVSGRFHPERATGRAAQLTENIKPVTAGGIVIAGRGAPS